MDSSSLSKPSAYRTHNPTRLLTVWLAITITVTGFSFVTLELLASSKPPGSAAEFEANFHRGQTVTTPHSAQQEAYFEKEAAAKWLSKPPMK